MNLISKLMSLTQNEYQYIILILLVLFGLLYYTFYSIRIYKLSKKYNMKEKWMSWVPYLNIYYLGVISNNYIYGIISLFLLSITSFSKSIIIDVIIYLLYDIIYTIMLSKIYKKNYKNKYKKYSVFTFLTLTFGSLLILNKTDKI